LLKPAPQQLEPVGVAVGVADADHVNAAAAAA
jgi:hypothetical protein